MTINTKTADRFRRHVKTYHEPNGCLLWTGKPGRNGHGSFYIDGAPVAPARVAAAIAGKDIAGLSVSRGHCGNPLCVNPAHFIYTQGRGRPRRQAQPRDRKAVVNLTADDIALLDRMRGDTSRSDFLRDLYLDSLSFDPPTEAALASPETIRSFWSNR